MFLPRFKLGALVALALSAALAGCGGGSTAPAQMVTPPPPPPVTGVAMPTNVAVVTAKNAG